MATINIDNKETVLYQNQTVMLQSEAEPSQAKFYLANI